MPTSRMRMRPWLEMQINSNLIPGLQWVNKEEMIFQIPWKHAARHGWEMAKDACLFEKWAVHTGRYKVGEKEPDPKTWKANFRCAMNSLPDIKEVKDKSINKGNSAVRVYRMLPESVKIERKERKFKPSKESKKKSNKMDFDDSSSDDRLGTMKSNSLDDHSCYTDHSYSEQEIEIQNMTITTGILECGSSSLSGLGNDMQISLADSTNDLYPFEVSPSSSPSSAATEEEEEDAISDDIYQMFEPTYWHQANVDGKGYLSNEGGTHFTDLSSRDLPNELEKITGEIEFRLSTDFKTGLDLVSWLDPSYMTQLSSLPAISCSF